MDNIGYPWWVAVIADSSAPDPWRDDTKIIGLLRKESRKLNDDDSYELSTKLKAWFNKNVM